MTNETPTPETDNHARCFQTAGMPQAYRVLLDLARKLERERDEMWNAAIDAAIKEINRMMYAPSPRYDSLGRMTLTCAAKKIDSLRKSPPHKKGQP